MSKKILGVALLSLSMFGCAAEAFEGEEGASQSEQAQQRAYQPGESCGGRAGVTGGTIDKYGWCCWYAPCQDVKVCGITPVYSCMNCNDPSVDCSNKRIVVGGDPGGTGAPRPGGVY